MSVNENNLSCEKKKSAASFLRLQHHLVVVYTKTAAESSRRRGTVNSKNGIIYENWFCTYCKTVMYVEIKYIYTYKNIFFYQFIFFFTFSSRRQETSDTINWTQNLQLTGLIPHQPTTGHCYWTRRCPGSAKRGCGHWIGRVVQSGRGQGMSHFTDNVLNLAWREHSSVLKLVKWCQHVSGRRNTEVTQLCPPSVWPMTGLVKPPDAPQ